MRIAKEPPIRRIRSRQYLPVAVRRLQTHDRPMVVPCECPAKTGLEFQEFCDTIKHRNIILFPKELLFYASYEGNGYCDNEGGAYKIM